MVDVSQLVVQMHETLSNIHSTISSLSVLDHESRLDDLEQRRVAALEALQSGFRLESDDLARKRQAQREALAEQRRREDEEREARRRQEDEALIAQVADEDRDRHGKLEADTREVEESTETMMGNVEEEAQRMLEEGKAKLAALEAKRRELNRLIDEQLQMPLPTAPSRRKPREQPLPEMVASSNPVDIFEKRNDNGDGDRDAIPAEPTKEIDAISTEKSEEEGTAPQPSVEPAPAATQAAVVSENDAPIQESEKFLQDVTSHVVPGGFPSSALQSPASENMIISSVDEIVQSSPQINDEVVHEKEADPVTTPAEPAVEVLQDTLDHDEVVPDLHQQEQVQLPVRSEEVQQVEPVNTTVEAEEQDETTTPVAVEVSSELVKEVNQAHDDAHEVAHKDIHEGHEEGHDESHDSTQNGIHDDLQDGPHNITDEIGSKIHEEHSSETEHGLQQADEDKPHETIKEDKTPAVESHEDTVHDDATEEPISPVADANVPSISIHTTDMTEEYLREAKLEKEAPHDEPEKPAEVPVAEDVPVDEADAPSMKAIPEHSAEPEAVEDDTEAPIILSAPLHTPEDEPFHQGASDSPETVIHDVKGPHMSGEAGEPLPIDTPAETAVHDISEKASPEILPDTPHEESHEARHEEVDETNRTHGEPTSDQQPGTNSVVEEESVEEATNGQLDNQTEPTVSPEEPTTTSLPASENVGVDYHEETAPESQTPTATTPVEATVEDPHNSLSHDSELGYDADQHDVGEHEALAHDAHDIGALDNGTDNIDHAAHDKVDHEIRQEVVGHDVVNDNQTTYDNGHDVVAGPEAEPLHEPSLHEEANSMHIAEVAGVVESHDEIPAHDIVVGHPDAPTWHYQEHYVAQDVYSYPYAAAQEYIDYGSSYYASAQQSLDPSPVFHEVHETPEVHEAVGEPVLDENMIFGGAEDTYPHGHAHALSLDKELEDVESEEEEGEKADTDLQDESRTITLNEVHEMHQDAVPEPEHAATMHGQDDLFDDDSEESAGSVDSDTIDQEEHDGHKDELALEHEHEHLQESGPEPESSHEAEVSHETTSQGHENDSVELHDEMSRRLYHEAPLESDIPHTPTTIVGDTHPIEHEDEEVTQFATAAPEDERPVTPDAATPLASQFKGLANSRHAPRPEEQQIPVTPPRQTAFHNDEELDEIDFMPRDVTNVPWQERAGSIDATPGSVRSQATLSTAASSSFGSPSPWSTAVVAAITPQTSSINSASTAPQDDPFIRTSWSSTPDAGDDGLILGRGKPIGQLDYKFNGHVVQLGDPEKRSLALDTVQTPPRTNSNSRPSSVVATSSPSSLFQRMRSIFEPPNGGVAGGVSDSPVKPSTAGVNSAIPAPRDPYPATSNTANHLVEGGFIRGIHPSDSLTQNDDDDEDDQINEKSSLLQESAIDIPLH